MLSIANATGCSSIYGGNLPTTPWTTDADGPRPRVVQLALRGQRRVRARLPARRRPARALARTAPCASCATRVGAELVDAILDAPQLRRVGDRGAARAGRRAKRAARARCDGPAAADLRSVARPPGAAQRLDRRRRRLGLRHRLRRARPRARERRATSTCWCSTPRSTRNTGGQMSKATPLGAVGKFAAAGKDGPEEGPRAAGDRLRERLRRARRDGGRHSRRSTRSARRRPSTARRSIIAYSHCIAHGYRHARRARSAVPRGRLRLLAALPLRPDGPRRRREPVPARLAAPPASRFPTTPTRAALPRARQPDPAEAERLLGLAEQAVAQRWEIYEEMATSGAQRFPADARKER